MEQNYLFSSLLSFISYLLSGNDNFREKRRAKSEKMIVQKETTTFLSKIVVYFWVQGRDLNPRPPGYHFVPVAVVCREYSPVRLCSLALWATPLSKTIHRIVFDSLTQRATLIGLITRYIKRRTDMVRHNVDEVNNLDIYVPKAQLEKGW